MILPGGAIPIRPITGWPSLAPSSPTRRLISFPCGLPSVTGPTARRRAYHVPPLSPCGLGRASSPAVPGLRRRSSEPPDPTAYLLVQAYQHLALGLCDDDSDGASRELTVPHNPGSQPPSDAGSRGFDLAISATLREGGGYVVPAASHLTIPRDARAGRIPRAVPRVMSLRVHDSNSGDIVSHPNDPAHVSAHAELGVMSRAAARRVAGRVQRLALPNCTDSIRASIGHQGRTFCESPEYIANQAASAVLARPPRLASEI